MEAQAGIASCFSISRFLFMSSLRQSFHWRTKRAYVVTRSSVSSCVGILMLSSQSHLNCIARRLMRSAANAGNRSYQNILSLDKSTFTQSLQKGSDHTRGFAGRSAAEKADHWHRRLLRARRNGPSDCRAAERDEVATFHRLTPRPKDHGLSIVGQSRASQQSGYSWPSWVIRVSGD